MSQDHNDPWPDDILREVQEKLRREEEPAPTSDVTHHPACKGIHCVDPFGLHRRHGKQWCLTGRAFRWQSGGFSITRLCKRCVIAFVEAS